MTIELAIVAFVAGAAVSLTTSWLLVSRLERVGERFGLSESLLGVLAALAADAPEITASITALTHHQRSIGAGVVIGSNVFNLAALLGLGVIVAGRIGLHRRVIILGGSVALWVSIICLGSVTKTIDPELALFLVLALLLPYLVILGSHQSSPRLLPLPSNWANWLASAVSEEELELQAAIRPEQGKPRDAVVALLALLAVVAGSVAMERGASTIGVRFAISDAVVGGLILAAVTSLPNVVGAVYLAGKGKGTATFSTALNSNNLNVVAGLLIPGAILGLASPSTQGLLIAWWYLGLTILTLALAFADRGLRRFAGAVIVVGYLVFVVIFVVTP